MSCRVSNLNQIEICMLPIQSFYQHDVFFFQATLQLKTAFTSPNIVSALIEVLSASQNPIVSIHQDISNYSEVLKL